ncbi:unnamed protein product [Echinostoma caproni]|uniref:Uncharacterized protein n=1 Tax=Echinostoma caproni TaxID=27848 RepID=A0A183BDP7_9TREM|nr:unnamed protein product [Echinostoma caproni]
MLSVGTCSTRLLRKPQYGPGGCLGLRLATLPLLPYDQASRIASAEEALLTAFSWPRCFPTKTSELIELLETLQHSAASADAATRRAIAQFPPELSDSNKALEMLEDGE